MHIPFEDRIVRIRPGLSGDDRREFPARVLRQGQMVLPKNSDIDEEDLVEWTNPAGHPKLLRVTEVRFNNASRGSGDLDHTEVHLERSSRPRQATSTGPVTITSMHEAISRAAGRLYADGHYSQAVFEAFKAVETRVKTLSSIEQSGKRLMSQAFGTSQPKLDISTTTGQSAVDEREGFNQIFMGVVQALRDPRGHGQSPNDAPDEAIEYLALASLLMRRLDIAESRNPPPP